MNIKQKIFILASLIIASTACFGQRSYTNADSVIYKKYITEFSKYKNKPLGELIVLTSKHFLGKPYASATLENNEEEKLVVNLREFDCTTLVESSIALAKELQKYEEMQSFDGFMKTLQEMRYREGKIDGYASRIHYTSDWVYENTDLFENITVKLGGTIVDKPLSFMSSKPNLYPALKASKANRGKIHMTEQSINKRKSYALLPISKIKQAERDIKTGDIIIFGTNVHGLDYSHIGIALWEGRILKMLHASSARKRVVIDAKSLVEYCATSKSCTGITVLRPTDRY